MGASNRSTDSKVWYALGTEGGVKEGRPLFKQWLKKRPVPQPQNFEEVNGKYYLTFDTMSGVVEIIKTEKKELTFNGKTDVVTRLYVTMSDKDGTFNVDLGNLDGRYAQNFLMRLLRPELNIDNPVSISPYKMETEDGGLNMGVVVYQGSTKMAAYKKEELSEMGCPPAGVAEFKGKKFYDFMPVASWLFARVDDKIKAAFLGGAPEPEHLPDGERVLDPTEVYKTADIPQTPQDAFKEDDTDPLPF